MEPLGHVPQPTQHMAPQPTQTTVTEPRKHGHNHIFLYILVLLLLSAVGAVYVWQHKKVTSLNTQVSSLTTQLANSKAQLTDREKALSSLPNLVKSTNGVTIDLVAFLGANNTQCYKINSDHGWFEITKEVNDSFAEMKYGCITATETSPSGAATFILAKKSSSNWQLISPTNQWVTINGVQYPSCTMINDNKISKQLEPKCALQTTVNGQTQSKLQDVANP